MANISYKDRVGAAASTTLQYAYVRRITSNQTMALNTDVVFNIKSSGSLDYNTTTGVFSLLAGKTYNLKAYLKVRNDGTGTTGRYIAFSWVDATSNTALVDINDGVAMNNTSTLNESTQPIAGGIYTPASNQTVKVRVIGIDGSNFEIDSYRSYAEVMEMPGRTIIDPTAITVNDQSASGYLDIGTTRIQWGRGSYTHNGTVTFPVAFANTNYSITFTSTATVAIFRMGTFTTSSVQTLITDISNGATSTTASYIAIGLKP